MSRRMQLLMGSMCMPTIATMQRGWSSFIAPAALTNFVL